MSRVFTVTVITQRDPRSPGDAELRSALRHEQWPSPVAARDDIYFLELPDSADLQRVEKFAVDFLAGDPTRVPFCFEGGALPDLGSDQVSLLIERRAGVMDPVEGSVLHALRDADLGIEAHGATARVRTARRYRFQDPSAPLALLEGKPLAAPQLKRRIETWAWSHLANAVVDEVHVTLAGAPQHLPPPFAEAAPWAGAIRAEVPLRRADRATLEEISRSGGLALDHLEMEAIRAHFDALGREPTDVELETLAQTWSEHCCHKTFTSPIDYDGEKIENLLKETIFAATMKLEAPFCLSVFKDNAGVIALDDEWGITFKVETHNHPSALEPYGGAGTGMGGVIRDTLGTGLGAEPILSTDVFCFGPPDLAEEELPPGTLHPRRIMAGVVAGVRDYGNRMGIPTANGAVHFHPGFVGNPLVFCGSVGLIPRDKVDKAPQPGDMIVAIGGRTGRDGIHGATFSSMELTEESESVSSGAVQIGNPIEEKKVHDALLRARDEGLFTAVTDCGAGGFSSAVGEMAEGLGAEVQLDAAPLKYQGLRPAEIWISEAQERMVLAVPNEHWPRLQEILAEEEVEGCVLGQFNASGQLRLSFRGEPVADLSLQFLHEGRPRHTQIATRPQRVASRRHVDSSAEELLRRLLCHPSIASKEPIIRQYDHEVQGHVVLRPLTGVGADAPNDGVAFDPLRRGEQTVVVGCGLHLHMGEIDPYEMGAQAVDEAVRNVVSSGGTLERLALLDNFAWGNVREPEILGAAIECARGAAAASVAYAAPFVSGKDSLHNTYRSGGVSRSIPHTLLVSAVSIVEGRSRAPSTDLKQVGNRLLLVGPRESGWSGSLAQYLLGGGGGDPARFNPEVGRRVHERVAALIAAGAVASCHDLSDGGLLIAAAEMGMGAGGLGVELDLAPLIAAGIDPLDAAFGEGPHRYLLELAAESVAALKNDVPYLDIGCVDDSGRLRVKGLNPEVDVSLSELHHSWRTVFDDVWPLEAK